MKRKFHIVKNVITHGCAVVLEWRTFEKRKPHWIHGRKRGCVFFKETTNSQDKNKTEQEIKAFLELLKKLPERVRALTGYEIAACGGSDGLRSWASLGIGHTLTLALLFR